MSKALKVVPRCRREVLLTAKVSYEKETGPGTKGHRENRGKLGDFKGYLARHQCAG